MPRKSSDNKPKLNKKTGNERMIQRKIDGLPVHLFKPFIYT